MYVTFHSQKHLKMTDSVYLQTVMLIDLILPKLVSFFYATLWSLLIRLEALKTLKGLEKKQTNI